MKWLPAAACVLLLFAGTVFGAGTVTLTDDDSEQYPNSKIRTIEWAISCSNGGTTTGEASGGRVTGISGKIVGVRSLPSTSAKPADDYDVEIQEQDGLIDICQSDLANMPQSATANDNLRYPVTDDSGASIWLFNRVLELVVTNFCTTGTKTGSLFLYIQEP